MSSDAVLNSAAATSKILSAAYSASLISHRKNNMTRSSPSFPVSELWTPEQDKILQKTLVSELRGKTINAVDWEKIRKETGLTGYSARQVEARWGKVYVRRGVWTKSEDAQLLDLIRDQRFFKMNGEKKFANGEIIELTSLKQASRQWDWVGISKLIPGRNSKQCRERWCNNLDPSLNHGPWMKDEDDKLMNLEVTYKGSWAKIVPHMKGRTVNSVKTRFHTLKREIMDSRPWSDEQDEKLISLRKMHGKKWAVIAKCLENRSTQSTRMRWLKLSEDNPELINAAMIADNLRRREKRENQSSTRSSKGERSKRKRRDERLSSSDSVSSSSSSSCGTQMKIGATHLTEENKDVVEALSGILPMSKRLKSPTSSAVGHGSPVGVSAGELKIGALAAVISIQDGISYSCKVLDRWNNGKAFSLLVEYANGIKEWIKASSPRIVACRSPTVVSNKHAPWVTESTASPNASQDHRSSSSTLSLHKSLIHKVDCAVRTGLMIPSPSAVVSTSPASPPETSVRSVSEARGNAAKANAVVIDSMRGAQTRASVEKAPSPPLSDLFILAENARVPRVK